MGSWLSGNALIASPLLPSGAWVISPAAWALRPPAATPAPLCAWSSPVTASASQSCFSSQPCAETPSPTCPASLRPRSRRHRRALTFRLLYRPRQRLYGSAAAISGLLAAAIPALVSIAIEGSPGPRHLLGFLVAGIAIWLIAATNAPGSRRTFLLAMAAGTGFGIYFVLLRYAGTSGVVWPMATARMGSISTCTLLLMFLPRPPPPPSPATPSHGSPPPPYSIPQAISSS